MLQRIESNPYSALTPSIKGQIKSSVETKLNSFLFNKNKPYYGIFLQTNVLAEFTNKSDIPEEH